MIQVQWFSAFLMLVGFVATAVVIVASYKRVNRETFEASTESWQVVVDTLKEHNAALKDRLDDAEIVQRRTEQSLATCEGKIIVLQSEKATLEKERGQLMSRNIYLFEALQGCRSRLERAGLDSGPDPNGMEGNPR